MSLFNDVVSLAKAGWKPSDVKAILDLDQKKEESAKNENQENVELKPVSKSEEKKEKAEQEIDYKAKYEEAQKKLDKIYYDNSRKEVTTDEPTIDYIVSDIASRIK